jgi:hypothetical protein
VTRADFVRRTSLDFSVGFNVVFRRINVLFLEFNKFIVVSSLVDLEEGVELVHERLALSEIEGFLSLDLDSEESNKLQSNLVVLETFNVVVVLSTTLFEHGRDLIDVRSDSFLQPFSKVLCVQESLLGIGKDSIEISTFFTLSGN